MTVLTQQKFADPRDYVISVSFMKVGKLYHFDFEEYPNLQLGDQVIVDTNMLGQQMGKIKAFTPRGEVPDRRRIYHVLRPATPADLLTSQQWQERNLSTLIACREKAAEIGGYKGVKFAAAEYNYNGTVLTVYFTSDEFRRVNTHRLRIALQKQLDTRVEFRQVGPRDVAKLQEGFGACGIPRCCSTFLTEFSMVSVTMAKAQGISLNPAEITGMCGRLRCCLTYEYKQYVEARRKLPRFNKRVGTEHGEGRVVELHPLQDAVTVKVNDEYHIIQREDLKPLEEWEALKKAAASPCSKSESGGCDCGARRPRGSADELMAEMGIESDPDEMIQETRDVETGPDRDRRHSRRRRHGSSRSRSRRNRGKKNNTDDSST